VFLSAYVVAFPAPLSCVSTQCQYQAKVIDSPLVCKRIYFVVTSVKIDCFDFRSFGTDFEYLSTSSQRSTCILDCTSVGSIESQFFTITSRSSCRTSLSDTPLYEELVHSQTVIDFSTHSISFITSMIASDIFFILR